MRVTVGNRDHLYALPTCKRYIAILLKLQQRFPDIRLSLSAPAEFCKGV